MREARQEGKQCQGALGSNGAGAVGPDWPSPQVWMLLLLALLHMSECERDVIE
jgi:hypothetical protein